MTELITLVKNKSYCENYKLHKILKKGFVVMPENTTIKSFERYIDLEPYHQYVIKDILLLQQNIEIFIKLLIDEESKKIYEEYIEFLNISYTNNLNYVINRLSYLINNITKNVIFEKN